MRIVCNLIASHCITVLAQSGAEDYSGSLILYSNMDWQMPRTKISDVILRATEF